MPIPVEEEEERRRKKTKEKARKRRRKKKKKEKKVCAVFFFADNVLFKYDSSLEVPAQSQVRSSRLKSTTSNHSCFGAARSRWLLETGSQKTGSKKTLSEAWPTGRDHGRTHG
jgi:hypothetical protein